MKKITFALILLILLSSCGSATPHEPITADLGTEFTLAPDQIATLADANLTVRLIGVGGDQRCPSEIECAVSGPVSVSLSVQLGDSEPTQIDLQVFTSNNGRAPEMEFEGIKDREVYEGYLIQVVSVLPYPAKRFDEIKDSEYRVSFLVTKK